MLRFSQKRKDAQLNKSLIAESLAAITASPSLLGPHSSPPMETMAVREPLVNFVRRGFLLPCSPPSSPIEVGESSRGGDSEEAIGFPRQCSTLRCAFKLWVFPLRGTRRVFWMLWLKWLRGNILRSHFPLLRLKGIENYITLSAISIMMLGVLVLLGAKARGLCCDVILSRVFGLVFAGVFWDFCCGWVFAGFFLVSMPFMFFCLFVYFLYAQGHLHFLQNFSDYLDKKKKKIINISGSNSRVYVTTEYADYYILQCRLRLLNNIEY